MAERCAFCGELGVEMLLLEMLYRCQHCQRTACGIHAGQESHACPCARQSQVFDAVWVQIDRIEDALAVVVD